MQIRFLNKCCKSPANIIILVDTRLSEQKEASFKALWGQMCFFNSFCSNSRGIAVLIRDNLEISNVQWQNIIKEHFSRLTFEHNKLKYLVKCLYAPNKDMIVDINNENTIFFKSIFDDSNDMEYDHCVMTGDYNVALKHEIDTNGYLHINNPYSRQYMKMRIATSDLTDIW